MKLKTLLASSVASAMVLLPPPGGFLTAFAAGNTYSPENVDPDLLYFVDCGDRDTSTLSDGDKFGIYNSVTEQFFGEDPVTHKMWGIDDTYAKNDTYPTLLTGKDTWPYEQSGADVGCVKAKSYRYAKGQEDPGDGPGVTYKFELEDGVYSFEVGFYTAWSTTDYNRKSSLKVNDKVIAAGIVPSTEEKAPIVISNTAEVTGGTATLNLNLDSDGRGGPMMSWIKIQKFPYKLIDTTDMEITGTDPWSDPWNPAKDYAKNAFDGDENTFFDGLQNGWAQIDLGEETPIAAIGFIPRPNFPGRMVNSAFYGSNDGDNWTELYRITVQPLINQETRVVLNEIKSWRYIKYENNNDYCNVNEIYLYTPAIDGTPTASLGWDAEKGFTVNFSGESGDATAIRVYHENAESGIMEPLGTDTELEGNTGVAVYTPYTNRIYSAAFSDGTNVGTASAKTSIYSLVIDEILNFDGESASAARIAAANKVISAGGVYLNDGNLTAEASKIMKYEGDTLSMNTDVLNGLEIGFTVKDGAVYLGSSGNSELVEATEGDTEKVYKTLKIDTVNNTITFGDPYGDDAASSEALTLSLDSVNIEFVETLVQELEASGADAVADFLPEL